MRRSVEQYVNALLRRRRPGRFRPGAEDVAVARTAIDLLAAGPDAQGPSPRFVEDLRRRVAASTPAAEAGAGVGAPAAAAWRRLTLRRRVAASAPALEAVSGTGAPAATAWRRLTLRRRAAASAPALEAVSGIGVPAAAVRRRLVPRRREMLTAGALIATGTAGAVAERLLAGGTAVTAQPAAPDPPDVLSPVSGSWQTIAATTDLPEGAVLPFAVGAVTGFARRVGGRVQAISGICTHQGCRLSLDTPSDTLRCPCHGATFTLAGAPLAHPNRLISSLPALPRLPVRELDGHIQIYASGT